MSKLFIKLLIIAFCVAFTTLNVRYIADKFHSSHPMNDAYLSNATKSFDAENQNADSLKWTGNRSKCFSCERDLINRYGVAAGSFGQGGRCFDCSRQRLTPNGMLY